MGSSKDGKHFQLSFNLAKRERNKDALELAAKWTAKSLFEGELLGGACQSLWSTQFFMVCELWPSRRNCSYFVSGMCFRFSLFSCLLLCGVLDLLRVAAVLSSFLIYIYIYREREREEEKKEKIIPTFNKLIFFWFDVIYYLTQQYHKVAQFWIVSISMEQL